MPAARLRERAEYASRWLVWVFCFGAFGLGVLVFGFLVAPLVTLTSRDRETRARRIRRLLSGSIRRFVAMIVRLRGITHRIEGELPRTGNYLIVANHPTLIDALLLMALLPDAECVVKHELLRNPALRLVLRGAEFISNADTAEMLDLAVERLTAGRSLIVFPEGTRSVPGEALQFRLAAAAIAVRAGTPCLPVIVRCQTVTLPKHQPWYRISAQRPHYVLQIEAPIDVAPFVADGDLRRAKRRLNVFLQSYYNRALGRTMHDALPAAARDRRRPRPADSRLAANPRSHPMTGSQP